MASSDDDPSRSGAGVGMSAATDVLRTLSFRYLPAALPQVLADARPEQLSYETFLQRTLLIEATGKHACRVASRAIAGHLRPRQSLADFDFSFLPSLSKRHIRELATLSFVQTATSVVFLGPPGVGKTHLATALTWAALDAGLSVAFTTLGTLIEDLETAQQADVIAIAGQSYRMKDRAAYLAPTPALVVPDVKDSAPFTTS